MVTYVYFVRFQVERDRARAESSLIMRREKFISTNKDLEDIEKYVARYVGGDVEKVSILALNTLHGLTDA